MNKIIKDAFALTAITLVAGLALGAVYEVTKDPIAQQEACLLYTSPSPRD